MSADAVFLLPADGVAYANKDLKCTTILDMATLTGAQVSGDVITFLTGSGKITISEKRLK